MKKKITVIRNSKVDKSTFAEFLSLNGFKFKDQTNARLGRLNVSFNDDYYMILGEKFKYPSRIKKVAKRFSAYEPTKEWKYVLVFETQY